MKIKMLRKDAKGNVEVFYVDNVRDKKLHDTERKKERRLTATPIRKAERKRDLQGRQKLASELRKIKIKRKEME